MLTPVVIDHECDKIGCDERATFIGYYHGRYVGGWHWSYACPEHEAELRGLLRPPVHNRLGSGAYRG